MARSGLLAIVLLLTACAARAPFDVAPAFTFGRYEEGIPEIPKALTEALRPYRAVRGAMSLGWLDDGLLIATRFGESSQLHRVDRALGARTQITFFDEPVIAAWIPPIAAPPHFVYALDSGGDEFYQLFRYDIASGRSARLTDGVSRHESVIWSNSGAEIAYVRARRDGVRDVIVQPPDGQAEVLFSDEGGWQVLDFAPNDARLLLLKYVSINEAYLFELDRASGVLTPLLDTTLTASVRRAAYDRAGGVLFLSDVGSEFVRLLRVQDGGRIEVVSGDLAWDIEGFAIAPDGRYVALVVNEDGTSRVSLLAMPGRGFVALPPLPAGVVLGLQFDAAGERLAVTLSSAESTADVYAVNLTDRSLARWTRSEVGGLPEDAFVAPELIRYPTFDTVDGKPREVPAFLYRPRGEGPHPVLVLIHGGPESQFRPYFSATIQFLVNELGIAVVAPNVRGSAGYGKTYLKLDNGRAREDAVRDIGRLLDWIDANPALDSGRVAVMGGSYGGYMVLASLVHHAGRIAAGGESMGISHFVTFLEGTEAYRRDLRRAEYGDERDPEMRAFLDSISPLNRASEITAPLLVAQGQNDPRVPARESAQIVAAVRAHAPAWYVVYEQEGHGFRRKTNADHFNAATMLFLQRHLLDRRDP